MIEIAAVVRHALASGEPVVALESTVIAHGLPRPRNLEVALELEDRVRAAGALPATIGIVDGRAIIGLDQQQLERFATGDEPVRKASVRDLGPTLESRELAATTVAATVRLAAAAGIRVFATGGIGGVHRGGAASLDISADLEALARHPVAVVSAGAKAILDLDRTLEVLETLGVPILGYRTAEFPAFYSRSSGIPLEYRYEDPTSLVAALMAHWTIGGAGVIVANPPPAEASIPPRDVDQWLQLAEREAAAAGVSGKDLTPWMLSRIAGLSGGRAVATNVALLAANVSLAADLAGELARSG